MTPCLSAGLLTSARPPLCAARTAPQHKRRDERPQWLPRCRTQSYQLIFHFPKRHFAFSVRARVTARQDKPPGPLPLHLHQPHLVDFGTIQAGAGGTVSAEGFRAGRGGPSRPGSRGDAGGIGAFRLAFAASVRHRVLFHLLRGRGGGVYSGVPDSSVRFGGGDSTWASLWASRVGWLLGAY